MLLQIERAFCAGDTWTETWMKEREMDAGGWHTQSSRKVKTGEFTWKQELERRSGAWSHKHLHFLLQIQKLSATSFPSAIHSVPHAGQQDNFFLNVLLLKCSNRKNLKELYDELIPTIQILQLIFFHIFALSHIYQSISFFDVF